MTIFGPDASKWQGDVHWDQVDATMEFGFEKVSEGPGRSIPGGSGYVSERWGPEKPEMAARARASGFIPGGYLFLSEGDGAAQAEFYAEAAGDMSGFMIVVDVEPREPSSHPTEAQARACVARLRVLYPGHPVGGYIPKWYWGTKPTTFVDYLWSSRYISAGPASAPALYGQVPHVFWAGYGGLPVSLLQFTDKALVPGVSGPCDCSAFRGTADDLRTLTLPTRAAVTTTTEDDMIPAYLPTGTTSHPIAVAGGPRRLRFFTGQPAVVRVTFPGQPGTAADVALDGASANGCPVPKGAQAAMANRVIAGETSKSGTPGVGDGTEEISFIFVP